MHFCCVASSCYFVTGQQCIESVVRLKVLSTFGLVIVLNTVTNGIRSTPELGVLAPFVFGGVWP